MVLYLTASVEESNSTLAQSHAWKSSPSFGRRPQFLFRWISLEGCLSSQRGSFLQNKWSKRKKMSAKCLYGLTSGVKFPESFEAQALFTLVLFTVNLLEKYEFNLRHFHNTIVVKRSTLLNVGGDHTKKHQTNSRNGNHLVHLWGCLHAVKS